jgi:hypothetical protein
MSVTIVSVHLKTESGDDYLFTYDQVDGVEDFVDLVEKDLGEELAWVSSATVNVLYSSEDVGEWERELWKRINEMGDDE